MHETSASSLSRELGSHGGKHLLFLGGLDFRSGARHRHPADPIRQRQKRIQLIGVVWIEG
jgi:hypothetical protein